MVSALGLERAPMAAVCVCVCVFVFEIREAEREERETKEVDGITYQIEFNVI